MKMLRTLAAFACGFAVSFIIFGLPRNAPAQVPGGGVIVQGAVTPGNCVQWVNSDTIQDAGKTC